jgi:4-amino-4-deoxy-L-arabinose transferase-like glycosyltransferase
MKNKRFFIYVLLGLIFLLSLFLRIYKLNSVPSGFHYDEVFNAYIGRFTLLHGVDLYGNKFPLLFFNKEGDYPPIIPMYISALGTFLFGVNVFGARIVPAFINSLIIFPVYCIALFTFKNKKVALFTAFVSAVTPWQISFSRIAAEGMLATTVYTTGMAFLLYSLQSKKQVFYFCIAAILLLMTNFLYPSFRIIVPLTFIAAFILLPFQKKIELRNISGILLLYTCVSIALTIYIGTTSWGKGRLNQTSYLSAFQDNKNPYSQFLNDAPYNKIERVFHNKLIFFSREFIKQYLQYFSPNFLFIEGGKPDWFKVPLTGLFYITLLLFLVPIILRGKNIDDLKINKKYLFFLFLLIFISPIPAALTDEQTPNVHRSVLLSVSLLFLFGYGFYLFMHDYFKYKIIFYVMAILLCVETLFFFHNYFQHVSAYTAVLREDGNPQAVKYILNHKEKYNDVYMFASGIFPIYYLYFSNNFDSKLIPAFKKNIRIAQVGKVHFYNEDCLPQIHPPQIDKKSLIIMNCEIKEKTDLKEIDAVVAAGNTTVFHIYEK